MESQMQVRVLVVDDEPSVLDSISVSLSSQRTLTLHTASTVLHARALLHAERFDVILCDISLPDGDGRQLIREALALNHHIRAVLISGFLYDGLMIPADLYGKLEFLPKPFTPEELRALFRTRSHHPQVQRTT